MTLFRRPLKASSLLVFLCLILFPFIHSSCGDLEIIDNILSNEEEEVGLLYKITQDGSYECEIKYNNDSAIVSLEWDNGDTTVLTYNGPRLSEANDQERRILVTHDGWGNLNSFKIIFTKAGWNGFPIIQRMNYSQNSTQPHTMFEYEEREVAQGVYIFDTTYTLRNLQYNAEGVIQSGILTAINTSFPDGTYDFTCTSNEHSNFLYMNQAYICLPEFNDLTFQLSKFSTKNLAKVELTEQSTGAKIEITLLYALYPNSFPMKITMNNGSSEFGRNFLLEE
ncbi:MAG: hypothetical protein JXR19_07925 [Bacteroidia bacterium]